MNLDKLEIANMATYRGVSDAAHPATDTATRSDAFGIFTPPADPTSEATRAVRAFGGAPGLATYDLRKAYAVTYDVLHNRGGHMDLTKLSTVADVSRVTRAAAAEAASDATRSATYNATYDDTFAATRRMTVNARVAIYADSLDAVAAYTADVVNRNATHDAAYHLWRARGLR